MSRPMNLQPSAIGARSTTKPPPALMDSRYDVGFARLAPFGGGLLRDQPARADRHLARTKAQVPHFEIHGLRDAVSPAKLRDRESRRERGISDDFAAGDFGARHLRRPP